MFLIAPFNSLQSPSILFEFLNPPIIIFPYDECGFSYAVMPIFFQSINLYARKPSWWTTLPLAIFAYIKFYKVSLFLSLT